MYRRRGSAVGGEESPEGKGRRGGLLVGQGFVGKVLLAAESSGDWGWVSGDLVNCEPMDSGTKEYVGR